MGTPFAKEEHMFDNLDKLQLYCQISEIMKGRNNMVKIGGETFFLHSPNSKLFLGALLQLP